MKIPTPRWYDKLSRKTKNIVDQIAHVSLGLILAIGHPLLSVWAVYAYEFFLQWPIDRPRDTRMDMGFWFGGTTIGTAIRYAICMA